MIAESDSAGQQGLHATWIISDINAKAIVTVEAAAYHLPGRRATYNRTENVTPTWWSILARGYLGARAIIRRLASRICSGLSTQAMPSLAVVPSSARIEGKE